MQRTMKKLRESDRPSPSQASTHRMNPKNCTRLSSGAYSFLALAAVFFVIRSSFDCAGQTRRAFGDAQFVPQRNESSQCKFDKPRGSESLPRGIITSTSDVEMKPLFGPLIRQRGSSSWKNLLAIAAGIKQKKIVDQIVTRFISGGFSVMLFHYDGSVDEWRDFPWCDRAVHVSAINQTKWWFAKRFLHPDIVSEYSFIFLWDEDLGVEHFHPGRYLKIIREEGLEISQPAVVAANGSWVHHRITARQRRNKFHRRCSENSTGPPCAGWVEVMAPVFSRAAWRCTWHMIQNDLIHAWGLDFKLGYCAQGHRAKKIGVVDAEYVVHKAIPTLGGLDSGKGASGSSSSAPSVGLARIKVRKQSYAELEIFKQRWKDAEKEDECWSDPYSSPYSGESLAAAGRSEQGAP